VDNTCIYVNPGAITIQAGARSDAEQLPRKIKATESYSFNMSGRLWGAGTALAPSCWTLTGAGATVAKNTTAAQIRAAPAGAAVTRVGTDCRLTQNISSMVGWADLTAWKGKTVTFGRWVYATAATRARISIFDGVTRTSSAYHSGGSTPEFLTVTQMIDVTAPTQVTLECDVDTGNTTSVFSGGAMIAGSGLAPVVASPAEWLGASTNIPLTTTATNIPTNSTHSFLVGLDPAQTPVAFAGVLSNFRVASAVAAGAGQSFTYTVRKNTVSASITTSISGAAQTTANDLVNQVTLAAGDTFDILAVISVTGAATTHAGCIRFDEIPF
jgi:hypothetical protein